MALSPGCTALSQKRRTGVLPEDVQVHEPLHSSTCMSSDWPIACIVSKVLEAEPTIRVILVACHLASCLRQPHNIHNLPVLDFWLSSLQSALREDPFWGPDFLHHLESRAGALQKGIQSLVQQCLELEQLVRKEANTSNAPTVAPVKAHRYTPPKPTNLRTSKLADKQAVFAGEENSCIQKVVLGCWTTLLADATHARRKASVSRVLMQASRARCLTS